MKVKITILIVFLLNAVAIAQNSYTISYGEPIDMGQIDSHIHFLISDAASKTTTVKGDRINSYKFQKPGLYTIKVVHDDKGQKSRCEHLPADITVNVSRIKMVFLSDRLAFSAPILKNRETSGTTLSIPIQIQTYDHEPISLNATPVNTAGIGTAIMARLDKDYGKLKEGEHILTYNLNGVVAENSYLMFDFIDANGKIQPVALTKPINN